MLRGAFRLLLSTIGGTVTQYLYDGDALVGEYNSSGALQRRYVHGGEFLPPESSSYSLHTIFSELTHSIV